MRPIGRMIPSEMSKSSGARLGTPVAHTGAMTPQTAYEPLTEDAEPNTTEHFEVTRLLRRLHEIAEHCEGAIRHAHTAGDLELALALEDVLCDAHRNVRTLRDAIASRTLPANAPPARTASNTQLRAIDRGLGEASSAAASEERTGVDVPPAGPRAPIVIHVDGLWFQLPSGDVVDCADRRLMRRLLACLMQQRLQRPGEPVPVETLLVTGWPEEPAAGDAAKNRLRVAMVRLRRLGLHTLLRSHYRGGYLLDPHVPVRVSGEQAA